MTPDSLKDDVWILNAAPFIGLAKIARLELLTAPGRVVLLPETVACEVAAGPPADAAVLALSPNHLAERGIGILPPLLIDPRLSAFHLDAGEAAVLTAALVRPDSLCIIDDKPGRAAAKVLGLDVTGTIGVLLQARREGRLPAIAPELRGLQAAGLYLPHEDILRDLLVQWGEPWP